MNNLRYVATFYKWLYENGIKSQNEPDRARERETGVDPGKYYLDNVTFNRANFKYIDPADANNTYLWIKTESAMQDEQVIKSQSTINDRLYHLKTITTEFQLVKPVLVKFAICANPDLDDIKARYFNEQDLYFDSKCESYVEITLDDNAIYVSSNIQKLVYDQIIKAFDVNQMRLGGIVKFNDIVDGIYSINGVQRVRTIYFPENGYSRACDGVSFASWSEESVLHFHEDLETEKGRRQFSAVDTAGSLINNREYKEGFDKFKAGYVDGDAYIWRALSAIGDQTGAVLYENVKNYIDYVTNVDLCKVQSLRSMLKLYGLDYKVFENLNLLPVEILDLINVFSIGKKYLMDRVTVLDEMRAALSAEGVVYDIRFAEDFPGRDNLPQQSIEDESLSGVTFDNRAFDEGRYYSFVSESFKQVISGFMSLRYTRDSQPIYTLDGDEGVYDELTMTRQKYVQHYDEQSVAGQRRYYKITNGVPLQFDERAALDRIEAGQDSEDTYSGARLELI